MKPSWQLRQQAQTFGTLAQITRTIGGIAGLLNDAQRVSQVNQQLAYLEQSYQDYNESLQQKMFDARGEMEITGPSGGQAPSVVKKPFGQASLADIEADEDKFFQSQLDYITKNTTNLDARREMIQHLNMKNIQNKGVINKRWEISSQHEFFAGVNALADTLLSSDELVEVKVNKMKNRLNAGVNVGRMYRDDADSYLANFTAKAQYSFAYNMAMTIMKATDDPTAAEAWLQEGNTPFFDDEPEKRTEIIDEVWRQWGLKKEREGRFLKEDIERVELNFMDRLQTGDIPTWTEIRDSILPRDRKEHYQEIINGIAKTVRDMEADRLKEERNMREAKQKSDAYFKAYSEIVDWPMNQEEKVEDRILGDELLTNDDKEHLIDEYRQRMSAAADRPKNPLEVTDDSTLSELIRMFYDSEVPNDAVDAFIKTKHGYGLSNADAKTWLDKVKARQPYDVYKLSVDMVKQYYDDKLKEETSTSTILTDRKQEALIIKQIIDEAAKGKLTEDGLLQFASNLLIEPKKHRVGGWFSRMETEEEFRERTEPEVKEAPAAEAYEQEMIDRFTQWSGAPPVAIGDNEQGELLFSDGKWLYVYRRRAWYRWDGTRWRMLTK